jgi:hypothetical protein
MRESRPVIDAEVGADEHERAVAWEPECRLADALDRQQWNIRMISIYASFL